MEEIEKLGESSIQSCGRILKIIRTKFSKYLFANFISNEIISFRLIISFLTFPRKFNRRISELKKRERERNKRI